MRLRVSEYMRMLKPLEPSSSKARRVVGRDARRERDRAEMRDLVLVGAVVVHLPDFFVAGAAGDVVDLGFGDAGDAAAEAEDDLVGEAVGDWRAVSWSGGLVVLLAEDLGVLRFFASNEPAVDDEAAAGRRVPEGDHGGGGGAADHWERLISWESRA